MYFSRTGQPLDLVFLLLQVLLWGIGGFLLVRNVFRIHKREQTIVGFAVGFLLFIWGGNLLAQILPLNWALWITSGSLFLFGVGSEIKEKSAFRDLLPASEEIPLIIVTGVTFLVFALINRGLAIFDDYHNLPLVSVIASGDVPPHHYLNAEVILPYHYGLHFISAAWMAIGGLFPWSAFDIAKALTTALSISLIWLWFRRHNSRSSLAILGTVVAIFIAGTRWLLAFAPIGWLKMTSANLSLIGSGAATGSSLLYNLSRNWAIEGGGPIAFPFAYANGIMPPVTFMIAGNGTLHVMNLLVLLLLFRSKWSLPAAFCYGIILGTLALSSEVLFVAVFSGITLGLGLAILLRNKPGWRFPPLKSLALILCLGGLVAVLQGGVLTELGKNLLGFSGSTTAVIHGNADFRLFWPPAIISSELGELELTNPNEIIVALFEMGPAIIFAPFAIVWSWRRLKRGNVLVGGLGAATTIFFMFPLVFRYGTGRDTTRIMWITLFLWILLGMPAILMVIRSGSRFYRYFFFVIFGVGIFGGIMLLGIQLTAITKPVQTYFADSADARISRMYWDALEPDAEVFDHTSYRSVTLFGRAVRSHETLYRKRPSWQRLVRNPDVFAIAGAGYSHIYVDEEWWNGLTEVQQASFDNPCVKRLAEVEDPKSGIRWLFDIEACR
jgi:hypothetical protein